jgi:hypothetical protein
MQTLLNTQPDAEPAQPPSIPKILEKHFFRRFFDNDTLSLAAETETSVIRALCAFAVPSLMVAFWLLPSYPGVPPRTVWAIAADRYFFTLYSFVAMGAVATFQWEMLFPDRADFLILLPLPLKSGELFKAKGKALLAFLGMFLVAANIFAAILYPAVSTRGNASYLHTLIAHGAAITLAGIFAAATMLAIAGIAICILPPTVFRTISPILQSLAITALVVLFLVFPAISVNLPSLLTSGSAIAKSIPPLWFLGLYEYLALGQSAPADSATLAGTGVIATALACTVAVAAYPLAWQRQKKRALEGASQTRTLQRGIVAPILYRTLFRHPQQRAVFHFLTQTITRFPRYQVYLALYSGVGFALALASILTLRPDSGQGPGHSLILTLWQPGLHALIPLLLFWMILGLKAAFAFPADMQARWVFPMNLVAEEAGRAARSAKNWLLLCCALLVAVILAFLLAIHWSYWDLAIQGLAGICLSLLLTNLFFLGRTRIPFTSPRLPGRTNLAQVFVLYLAVFPTVVLSTVNLELQAERNAALLYKSLLYTAIALAILKLADHLAQKGIIADLPEEEEEDGPQTLGLSR